MNHDHEVSPRLITAADFNLCCSLYRHDSDPKVSPPTPAWVRYVTTTPQVYAFLVFIRGEAATIVQYDCDGPVAYVSVYTTPAKRGRGYLRLCLARTEPLLPPSITTIEARITEDNASSLLAFQHVGFSDTGIIDEDGCKIFRKSRESE